MEKTGQSSVVLWRGRGASGSRDRVKGPHQGLQDLRGLQACQLLEQRSGSRCGNGKLSAETLS